MSLFDHFTFHTSLRTFGGLLGLALWMGVVAHPVIHAGETEGHHECALCQGEGQALEAASPDDAGLDFDFPSEPPVAAADKGHSVKAILDASSPRAPPAFITN